MSAEQVILRKVTPDDVSQLHDVATCTFIETFSEFNTRENIESYLSKNVSIEKLANEIASEGSEFYFALLEGHVIGYLKLNFGESQTEIRDWRSIEIERIYVVKEFLGKNVGQILFKKAVNIANNRGADSIWLGVWEKNSRAIAFYRKNGFREFDKHIFRLGDDEQTDLMMKLDLKNK